ncbi:uncharacterized protein LOC126574096 [Anopheles aquasalis]|uniref:uncharacterized protein LOC126574096 n=1 Tax=Anopheles aquasalis TaxID=42839 RepID=UPI00215AB4A0|nr:uncharacterized protein LOC126574096 [Anopheles aquasalis]
MKCRSLFLMYYLHRESPSAIPPLNYDADWLACTAKSLYSKDFIDVTKWLLNPILVDKLANLNELTQQCDDEDYDLRLVNLEKLVKQVETMLSANRSLEDVGKLKLLALAVCLKHQSMIEHLCENVIVNIDWRVLLDIMKIAHSTYCYEPGTKYHKSCAFDWSDFVPVYKYLFERTTNLGETDAEGGNVLHLAVQSGLGCMAKFLIKQNIFNVTTTNEQNGWNIFHYYASTSSFGCCFTENDDLLTCITKRVLEITSDTITTAELTECRRNTMKELCFNSKDQRKSVIHVAVEAGNLYLAIHVVMFRLGIDELDKHKIRNSDEYERFRECYDELSQIADELPFNEKYDFLLRRLAKHIEGFSHETIQHITKQGNVDDHALEDACRIAIKCRSVSTLEHLIIAYKDQMNQALARSTSNELIACMMECVRRNRNNLFKMLIGHYCILQGIQPSVEVEFEKEENDKRDEATIDKHKILWPDVYKSNKDVAIHRNYLHLIILLVAYGRLPMIQNLVEMLQLEINKSLILSIMKALEKLWDENCKVATPVYEYLARRCEGKPNLLHLCFHAGCWSMFEYLIKKKKHNANEVDSENGWNAGHYCVSEPASDANSENAFKVFELLMKTANMNCFGVYDRNGRSILHLALENGHTRVVKLIVNHRLGIKGDNEPWMEGDLKKIEKHCSELKQILESLPENVPQQNRQVVHDILETFISNSMVNGASAIFRRIFDPSYIQDNQLDEIKYIEGIIGEDSVWMLQSLQ